MCGCFHAKCGVVFNRFQLNGKFAIKLTDFSLMMNIYELKLGSNQLMAIVSLDIESWSADS